MGGKLGGHSAISTDKWLSSNSCCRACWPHRGPPLAPTRALPEERHGSAGFQELTSASPSLSLGPSVPGPCPHCATRTTVFYPVPHPQACLPLGACTHGPWKWPEPPEPRRLRPGVPLLSRARCPRSSQEAVQRPRGSDRCDQGQTTRTERRGCQVRRGAEPSRGSAHAVCLPTGSSASRPFPAPRFLRGATQRSASRRGSATYQLRDLGRALASGPLFPHLYLRPDE